MASPASPSPEAVELARQLDELFVRVRGLEMKRSLANASIDGGNLPIYDSTGNLQMTVGLLPDGTFGPNYYNPNPPPVPALPIVTPTWGGLMIAHFGNTAGGGDWPLDVSHIEIHLSSLETFFPGEGTLVGKFTGVGGGGLYAAMGLDAGVTYWVRLVAVNTSEKKSAGTAPVSGTPDQVVSQATIDQINADLQQVVDDVVAAANGRVFYNNPSTGGAVPAPTMDTATWFRPDQGYKQYRWDGDSWEPALLDTDAFAAAAITTGLLDVGAVTADKIAVGAITTEKLSVGSIGDNLILNGNFKDLTDGAGSIPQGWFATASAASLSTEDNGNETHLLAFSPASGLSGTIYQHTDTGRLAVAVGDQFHVAVGANSNGGTGAYRVAMHCYSATGTYLAGVYSGQQTTASYPAHPSSNRSSSVLTVTDANTAHVRFAIALSTAGQAYRFDKFTVGKVTVSARIADGAITAPKVFAKAITAEKIDTNAVRATHIEAGAITADKIHLGAKGFAVNDNSNFEQEATDPTSGALLGKAHGWRLHYDTTGVTHGLEKAAPLSGSQSARLDVLANKSAHLATDNPSWMQVQPGEKWFVSARVKAVGGDNVAFDPFYLLFATSVPGHDPFTQFNGSNSTQQASPAGAISNGEDKTITATFTVPANHRVMGIAVRLPPRTAAGYYLVEDFVAHPAVDNTMVTDISAGKLTTGFIQAGQKIIAGTSETGARTEMTDGGFFAYNTAGGRTFTVQGSDGTAVVGNPGSINIAMSAYANIWNYGTSQAMIRFNNPGSGWSHGELFSQYWTDGGGSNWAALRMSSPNVDTSNNAYLDVRQRNDGYSQFFLRATEANFSANTFIMGSGDGTSIDFRHWGGSGFTFADYGMGSRLSVYPQIGSFLLRSIDNAGASQQLRLQGSQVFLSAGGADVDYRLSDASNPILSHFGRNAGIGFGFDRMRVTNWWDNTWIPILASAFTVQSDPRLKDNAETVTGALAALRSVQVYDYDMAGLLPRKDGIEGQREATDQGAREYRPTPVNRGRGLMADEVRDVLPDAVNEDENGVLSVSLYDLLATAIAGLKELDAEVRELRAEVTARHKGTPSDSKPL